MRRLLALTALVGATITMLSQSAFGQDNSGTFVEAVNNFMSKFQWDG